MLLELFIEDQLWRAKAIFVVKTTMPDLKQYAASLLEIYVSINESATNSSLYWHLTQFVQEGRIKDVLPRNARSETKRETMQHYADMVQVFADQRKKSVTVPVL